MVTAYPLVDGKLRLAGETRRSDGNRYYRRRNGKGMIRQFCVDGDVLTSLSILGHAERAGTGCQASICAHFRVFNVYRADYPLVFGT